MKLTGISPGSIFKYKDHPKVKEDRRGKFVELTADCLLYVEERIKSGEELFVEPVPLTIDLLTQNCGFRKATDKYGGYLSPDTNDGIGIKIRVKENESGGFYFMDYPPMEYLHQLQLLHLALIGEEMSVNL